MVVLSACSFQAGVAARDAEPSDSSMADAFVDPTPWLAGYTHRKAIHLRPEGVAASLADVPIGILIAADPDLAMYALPTGDDLTLTAADGTTLREHELVSYAATGAAELWVKVPALQLDVETTLYLYFGGPAGTAVKGAVWTAGLKGVWHMTGSAGTELDSTANGNDIAQAVLSLRPGPGPGVRGLGAARAFDGIDDLLYVTDPINGSLDVGTGSFSISIWLHSLGATRTYDQALYKGGTNGGNPGYSLFNGTGAWAGKILDPTTAFIDATFAPGPITNRWVHLVLVVDRSGSSRWYTYVDGGPVANQGFTLGSLDGAAPLQIGGASDFFHGSIDEIRIYNRVLPAAWIKTEYDNLMKADFVTLGPLQSS